MRLLAYAPASCAIHVGNSDFADEARAGLPRSVPAAPDAFIMAMPAATSCEATLSSLVFPLVEPRVMAIIDTDDFVRIDRARFFSAIGRMEPRQAASLCADPDCGAEDSIFMVEARELEKAVICSLPFQSMDLPRNGLSLWIGNGGLRRVRLRPGFWSRARNLLSFLHGSFFSLYDSISSGQDARAEAIASLHIILNFTFLCLPILNEILFRTEAARVFGADYFTEEGPDRLLAAILGHRAMLRARRRLCQAAKNREAWRAEWKKALWLCDIPEALVELLSAGGFARLPKASDPCPCGSGRVFGSCHSELFI